MSSVPRTPPSAAPAKPPAAAAGADPGKPGAQSTADRGDGRDAAGRFAPREGEGAPEAEPAAAPAPAPPTRHKLKVNGEDRDAPDDLNEILNHSGLTPTQRQALIAHAQRALAADETFRSAATAREQTEGFVKAFGDGNHLGALEKLLQHVGGGKLSLDQVVQEAMIRKFEREQMSPEQRESADLKAEVERLRAEKQQREQEAARTRQENARRELSTRIDRQVAAALESPETGHGLPQTKEISARVRAYLVHDLKRRSAMDANDPRRNEGLSPARAVQLVREDLIRDAKALASGLDAKALRELLGDEAAKKLREDEVAQFENGGPRTEPTPPGYTRPVPAAQQSERRPMSVVRQEILRKYGRR